MKIATDEELVVAARRGDGGAMNELLGRHYDRVHAVCSRIAGATRDADDAAQETMIRVVRHLDKFDGRSSFGTWVYRIATNTSLDELRKRKRRPQLHVVNDESDGAPEIADPIADRTVEASVDRMAIDAALAELPEEFRVPLVMRDVGDLDYAEIAEALGVPLGTVKSRIARGRRQLVEFLENTDQFGNQPLPEQRPNPEPPQLS
ncbi:MAG TPA: sigma-70 family RNA polymerase sigma factor [Ilumatobacter sp.]|nr:sigma-70 family RNA polymerase sigma factor [Ilumatobacter sp.]